jgi:lipoprotein-releasing system permease protein
MLVITDRRSAIAILQVMGASRRDIAWIYLLQGALIGVLGATVGLALGGALAAMAPQLLVAIEGVVGTQLLNTDVYPLAFLPVDIRLSDILTLWVVSVFLCVASALIPAYRASKVPVAQALAVGSA